MTVRLFPPAIGGSTSVVSGKTYTCAPGGTVDVSDADAFVLTSNGWLKAAEQVGTTAQRPTAPHNGMTYHDTTLNLTILFEGKVWRNPATGGAV